MVGGVAGGGATGFKRGYGEGAVTAIPTPGLPPEAWQRIRAGDGPDPTALADGWRGTEVELGRDGVRERQRALRDRVLGAGPLEPLLHDPRVTDVLVNGAASVWVDRGAGLERVTDCHLGEGEARTLAVRLAGAAGRRLDDASPWVDATLPSGVRVHAVLPPLVDGGAHLSLRIPRADAVGLQRLAELGAFDAQVRAVLERLVAARVAFLVSGGTGTGKTTLLAALLAQVPTDERIVIVEDVREIGLSHPHVVSLQGRGANVEGRGEVALPVLLRQALRMRPDRLVLGEARGAEVRELLTALNTGHEGGCGTVHANSAQEVVSRLEALGALADWAPATVWAQVRSAVQVVVHLRRGRAGRWVEQIAVVTGEPGQRPSIVPALQVDRPGAAPSCGPGLPALQRLVDRADP